MPEVTPKSKVKIVAESLHADVCEYARILGLNAAIRLSEETAKIKARLALAAAEQHKEISSNPAAMTMPIEAAIKAADYSDPALSVGLLSGSLVLQQALSLLQYEYPIL